ncbi:glycoside hydrolase family 16 protein [Flavilitoribacter nigricans]|uniref:Beta-glucanase n=1 Tax=Flavilitoribacter nigricans (strain ATCC 23147 / DSM 23189 / NBRC 102662 / NCIMB 1420 / SS-2) TaxID=1122177 RepID=A0A2D0MYS1_FLAN2|nr:glycoside hydrolase family 16 protein [Flavilitoribacter nigricans]PHN01395.1 beta-glucanase [Flavilitoribacter nigricans DSM 23189 = NBRC 102662]
MVKIQFVRLCFLGGLIACSPKTASHESAETKTETYQLVWSDEFDTDGPPNPQNWTYERGFTRNEELQWYQEDNAFVKDGMLIIEGRRETRPNPDYQADSNDWRTNRPEINYTSSCVTTQGRHQWRYGRFEIKARIKTEAGLWPAIWTLGLGHEWPVNGEIDIMEFYGGNILANAAWAAAGRWQAVWDDLRKPVNSFNDPDWDDRFHIWRMDWTEAAIKIYLDDELLNTIDLEETINQRGAVKNPFRETEHYLLLNLAIGGKNGGDPSGTAFPTRYEIDYVRVYQQ